MGNGYQYVFTRTHLLRLRLVSFRRDIVGAALCRECRDDAGRQNHQNRAVQHAFVQQADGFSVGCMARDNIVADHHGRQRRGHVGRTQTEDYRALVFREAERLLREVGRDEFRRRNKEDHGGRNFQTFPVAEKCPIVDEHSNAD